MKKIIFSVVLVCGILILISFIHFHKEQKKLQPETIEYVLNGKKLHLYVADTSQEREKGLMFYRKLDSSDGMIFKFPDKSFQSFWNKNTFMDLDVYWINDKKVVGKSFLPSIEKTNNIVTIDSPEAVNIVIEVPRK